jgi:hypothetical protein
LASQRLHQQRYYQLIEATEGKFTLMTFREAFMPGQAVRILDIPKIFFKDRRTAISQNISHLAGLSSKSEISTSSTTVDWVNELAIFRKNVIDLCKYAGSDVDENATLQDIIQSLSRYAAEGKQKTSPLFEQNAQLKEELERCNRIRAALQIRHVIEKLMAELPQCKKTRFTKGAAEASTSKAAVPKAPTSEKAEASTAKAAVPKAPTSEKAEASTAKAAVPKATTAAKASSKKSRYDIWGSGPKWTRFWEDVWEDAQTNEANPFRKLFLDAKSHPYALKDIKHRGESLFSEMSQDIHWYWKDDIKCAYFDDLTKKIAEILWPTEIDPATGEPRWDEEIKKYAYKKEEVSLATPPAKQPSHGTGAAEPNVSEGASGATLPGPPGDETANDPPSPHDHYKAAVS